MPDIDDAMMMLQGSDFTCVIVQDGKSYGSRDKGIDPILDTIEQNYDIRGCAIADKVMGKAAALLAVYAGAKAVYGDVLSYGAWEVLSAHGIEYYFTKMTDKIMNRDGTDICPMEKTVLDITDPKEAYHALLKKRDELRGGSK